MTYEGGGAPMQSEGQPQISLRTMAAPYAAAVAFTALVFVIRCLLDPILDGHYAITPFVFAVAFAAWHGGWKPALLSLFLSLALSAYFFMYPRGSFAIEGVEHQTGTILYLLASIGSVMLMESLRAAKCKAELNTLHFRESE